MIARKLLPDSIQRFILIAALGLGIGLVILLHDWKATPESRAFVESQEFKVWAFITAVQAAFWCLIAVPLARTLKELGAHFKGSRGRIAGNAILMVALFVPVAVLFDPAAPLAHHDIKKGILTALGAAIGLAAAIGLWMAFSNLERIDHSTLRGKTQLHNLLRIREQMEFLVGTFGGVVAFAVLATVFRRFAQLAAYAENSEVFAATKYTKEAFDTEGILVYGAYLTVMTAIAYIPTHLRYTRAGKTFLERTFPMPEPESTDWCETVERRQVLEGLLCLRVSARSDLKVIMAVFAPLLSAGLTLFLH